MTDIENQQGTPAPEPVTPVPPKEVREAAFNEVHTPDSTPMKTPVPSKVGSIRQGEDKDRAKGFLNVFLGHNLKKVHEEGNRLLQQWMQLNTVEALFEDEKADQSMLDVARSDWASFLQTEYPDKTSEEVKELAANLFRFKEDLLDGMTARSHVINEPDVTNQSNRGSKIITGDIVGKKPTNATAGFSISELMHRSHVKSNNEEYQFDVLLRNSYTAFTFTRPDPLSRAGLINDIQRTVKGYVRTIGHNTPQLAQVAGMRVIWEYLRKRIVSSTVSDIVDFNDLARIIRITDFQTLCTALLRSSTSEGVNLNLHCLFDDCDWNEFQIVDPDQLGPHIRRSIETPEKSAIFANLANRQVKYTMAETLALIRKDTYGMETNRVYNHDQSIYWTIAPPSLAEAFESFDYYVSRVNPDLQDIRNKVFDTEEYNNQVGLYFATLGASEYIHWVSAFTRVGAPDTEEKDLVLYRHDSDAAEFNKGLVNVLLDDKFMNKEVTRFILNKTPFMQRSFVGLANAHCPKCKRHPDDVENGLERRLGYTPLNVYMAFFTLTQLSLLSQAVETNEVTQEVLSE